MINIDKERFLYHCKDQEFVQKIIDDFHKLWYYSSAVGGTWKNSFWMGIPIQKNPMDSMIYQELIYNIRPDYIIETGTKVEGSALFFASICDMINNGSVITIDISKDIELPKHGRITYLTGNSISFEIVDFLSQRILDKNKKVMVVLDSDHSKEHVLKELEIYSKFISVGSYLVVEDTNCSGHPVIGIKGEGPMEAVQEFLKMNNNFIIDRNCEKFYLTSNPKGWLKRTKN